ncbi:MAG: hypothetical protein EBR23_15800, partial [Planctomycetia bacterium]|nr:hypothetical protein [Planctomycetia bacterium]
MKHVPADTLLAPPQAPERASATPQEPPMPPPVSVPGPDAFHNEPLTDFSLAPARDAMQEAVDRFRRTLADRGPAAVPLVIGGVREESPETFARH